LLGEIRRQARLIAELGSNLGLSPQCQTAVVGIRQENREVETDPEFLAKFGPLKVIRGGRGPTG
jgi:phage terminase small subunit